MKRLLLFLFLTAGTCYSQNPAELLVQWDLGLSWYGYTPHVSYYNNAGNALSAGNLSCSNAVTNMGIDSEGFLSSNWSNNPNTPDYSKYYQVAVTPAAGKSLQPKMFRFQQDGYVKKFHVRYSTNPSFPGGGTLLLLENNAHNNQDEYFNVQFPANITIPSGQTLYIRIYGFHLQNGGSAWQINSFWNSGWNWGADNDAPQLYGVATNTITANDDVAVTLQAQPVSINVLANDVSAFLPITGVAIVSQSANGVAVVQPDKKILFTPSPNFSGTTTFVYKALCAGGEDTATVTVTVNPMVYCIAHDDVAQVLKNTTKPVNVLANDITGSGAISILTINSQASHGSVSIVDNVAYYTPQNGYTGNDSFSYLIKDIYNNSSIATVSLTIAEPVLPLPGQNTGVYCNSSTTWNGTAWSNGVPYAQKDAIFTGDYTQNGGTFTACSIFVTGSSQVVFTNESNALITNNVNVEASASLIFESSSNLVQTGNTPNVGNVTVKRFGSLLKRFDYSFWTSPVTGNQTLQEFSPATISNRFYIYETLNDAYTSVPASSAFAVARSYLIRMPDAITGPQAQAYQVGGYRFAHEGIFTGVPNNGDIAVPLVYDGIEHSINGVGNPYPSPISVSDFIDANINNIEGTIWIWRKTNNPDETSYCVLTKLGFIANSALGGGGSGGDDGNTLIADPFTIADEGVLNTGQGFLVKAKNNQNLVFRNSMRMMNNYDNFFRNASIQQTPAESNAVVASRIWLNATNTEETAFSQTLVAYTSDATIDYDNGLDAESSLSGSVCIYSIIEDAQLAIQGRPDFDPSDVVKLGFKAANAGEYTIVLDRFNGLFAGDQDIHIKDNDNGVIHDLRDSPYVFTSGAGTFENRFELVYSNEALGSDNDRELNKTIIYTNKNTINIKSAEQIDRVMLYDITGKVLFDENVKGYSFCSPALTSVQTVVVRITFFDRPDILERVIVTQ